MLSPDVRKRALADRRLGQVRIDDRPGSSPGVPDMLEPDRPLLTIYLHKSLPYREAI